MKKIIVIVVLLACLFITSSYIIAHISAKHHGASSARKSDRYWPYKWFGVLMGNDTT